MHDSIPTAFPIMAHRGGGVGRPENTLESIQYAWARSPRLIPELDVSTTRNGVLVAFHDEDLSRLVHQLDPALTGKSLKELTWEQAGRLDVGGNWGAVFVGQRMTRIDAALEQLRARPGRELYLDHKDASLTDLAELVRVAEVARQVIFASDDQDKLLRWRELMPGAQTLNWIWNDGPAAMAEKVERLRSRQFAGVTQIQFHIEYTADRAYIPDLKFFRHLAADCAGRKILLQAFPYTGEFGRRCESRVFRELIVAGATSFSTDYIDDALRETEPVRQ